MIVFKKGDILDSCADMICHQVNCQGVMGAGLALQIRNKYPTVYVRYKTHVDKIENKRLLLGFTLFTSINGDSDIPFIVNCFNQYGYGRDSKQTVYPAMRESFTTLRRICESTYDSCTIAVPYKMGCGLGGGDWDEVLKIIHQCFDTYKGEVQIWEREM